MFKLVLEKAEEPEIKPRSPALQTDVLNSEPPGKPTSMWDECNCWHCLSLGLEWKLTFSSLWPLLSFPNLLTYWVQCFNSIIFYDLKTAQLVFPVVMYRYKSWTIKKAECWRTDAFELWCWRRLLRVSWTSRSNQSILKEISPEYSLEGMVLKLNTLATWWEELTH